LNHAPANAIEKLFHFIGNNGSHATCPVECLSLLVAGYQQQFIAASAEDAEKNREVFAGSACSPVKSSCGSGELKDLAEYLNGSGGIQSQGGIAYVSLPRRPRFGPPI